MWKKNGSQNQLSTMEITENTEEQIRFR